MGGGTAAAHPRARARRGVLLGAHSEEHSAEGAAVRPDDCECVPAGRGRRRLTVVQFFSACCLLLMLGKH